MDFWHGVCTILGLLHRTRHCDQHFSFRPSGLHVHFTRTVLPPKQENWHFGPSILVCHELYCIDSTSRVNGSCLQLYASQELWRQCHRNERMSYSFDILHHVRFHLERNFFQVILDFGSFEYHHRAYSRLLLCFQQVGWYSWIHIPWCSGYAYRTLLHHS